jgi:hypothetical protein
MPAVPAQETEVRASDQQTDQHREPCAWQHRGGRHVVGDVRQGVLLAVYRLPAPGTWVRAHEVGCTPLIPTRPRANA